MITDSQLKALFAKANNIQIATTNGGKARQKIWFKLNGQKIQGTCIRNIKSGEAIALRTDTGEWFLANITDRPREEQSTRNLEFRKTKTKKQRDNPNFKILFSIPNGANIDFYIGGDRLTPIQIYSITSTAREIEGYIHNLGNPNQWEVSIKYTNIDNKAQIINLTPEQLYEYASSFQTRDFIGNNRITATGLFYKGGLTWITDEMIPILSASSPGPTSSCTYSYSQEQTLSIYQSGLLSGTSPKTYNITGVGTPPNCQLDSVATQYTTNYQTKNFFVNGFTSGENIGTYTSQYQSQRQYTGIDFTYRISESVNFSNSTFLPNTLVPQAYNKSKIDPTSDPSIPNFRTQSTYNFEYTVLTYKGKDFYIKEQTTYAGITTNDVLISVDDPLNDRLETQQFNATLGYSLIKNNNELILDTSPVFKTYFIGSTAFTIGATITVNYPLSPIFGDYDYFIGKKVAIAQYISEDESQLAKGEIIGFFIIGSQIYFNIRIDASKTVPFSGLARPSVASVIIEDGSLYTLFSWVDSLTDLVGGTVIFNNLYSLSVNQYRIADTIVSSQPGVTISGIFFTIYSPSVINNLFNRLSSVNQKFYIAQIKQSVKTQSSICYAEEWSINNNGKINRSDRLLKGKVRSLNAPNATIYAASFHP